MPAGTAGSSAGSSFPVNRVLTDTQTEIIIKLYFTDCVNLDGNRDEGAHCNEHNFSSILYP